jgi:ferredoxin, 2Fe-2S
MIRVKFVAFDGSSQVVETAPEGSLMVLAVANEIPGIRGDCGGAMACGTCQVSFPVEWFATTGEPCELEECLLEVSTQSRENSRLACQVKLSERLDGLVVFSPEHQAV